LASNHPPSSVLAIAFARSCALPWHVDQPSRRLHVVVQSLCARRSHRPTHRSARGTESTPSHFDGGCSMHGESRIATSHKARQNGRRRSRLSHQRIKLCRGREAAINHEKSCEFLIKAGNRVRHIPRSQATVQQYFLSTLVAGNRLVCNQEVGGSIPLVSTSRECDGRPVIDGPPHPDHVVGRLSDPLGLGLARNSRR